MYLLYNGSTTNLDFTLESLDIAELATGKITDNPGCGHRMMMIINFIIKPRTLNGKPHYAWNFQNAKWHMYKEKN
jgi:hypothetical protein